MFRDYQKIYQSNKSSSLIPAIILAICEALIDEPSLSFLKSIGLDLKKFNSSMIKDERIKSVMRLLEQLKDLKNYTQIQLLDCLSGYKDSELTNINNLLFHIINDIDPSYLNACQATANRDYLWGNFLDSTFRRKGLVGDAFKYPEKDLNLNSDMNLHVKWAFKNIYSIRYPNDNVNKIIAREIHGIGHVTDALMFVPVLINLYRKHNDADALKLNDEDVKLLQIAVMLHDAARENEGEDLWDHESALFLFVYLTNKLGVDQNKARLIAEAMANKDISKKGYYKINVDDKGNITGTWYKNFNPGKNIYQKIIHDADCLHIVRARPNFDAKYLDFYQTIAAKPGQEKAREEMAYLIMEVRSLTENQGDGYKRLNILKKVKFEHENCYESIKNHIEENFIDYPVLYFLGTRIIAKNQLDKIQLVPQLNYAASLGITANNIQAAMYAANSYVFVRAVASPTGLILSGKRPESQCSLELRKMFREPGIKTLTQKPDSCSKDGNQNRSVSMVGYGSPVFANAGFLSVKPNIFDVKNIANNDIGSGRGKKKFHRPVVLTLQQKTAALRALHDSLRLGGSAVGFDIGASSHNEITYDLKKVDAIYFSCDPNLYNLDILKSATTLHKNVSALEAIFLQNEYAKQYDLNWQSRGQEAELKFKEKYGPRILPIFEYSGIHNSVVERQYPEEQIVKLWQDMVYSFMRKTEHDIRSMDLDKIKILSMYGAESNHHIKAYLPADHNYSSALKEKVNAAIENERNNVLYAEKNELKYKVGKLDITDSATFKMLMQNDNIAEVQDDIVAGIQSKLTLALQNCSASNFFEDVPVNQVCLAPITAEEALLNPAWQRHFFTDLTKLYALAKKYELKEQIKLLQKHALLSITAAVKKYYKSLQVIGQSTIMQITAFIHAFDLQDALPVTKIVVKRIEELRAYLKNTDHTATIYLIHLLNFVLSKKLDVDNVYIKTTFNDIETVFLNNLSLLNNDSNRSSFIFLCVQTKHDPFVILKEWIIHFSQNIFADPTMLANVVTIFNEKQLKEIMEYLLISSGNSKNSSPKEWLCVTHKLLDKVPAKLCKELQPNIEQIWDKLNNAHADKLLQAYNTYFLTPIQDHEIRYRLNYIVELFDLCHARLLPVTLTNKWLSLLENYIELYVGSSGKTAGFSEKLTKDILKVQSLLPDAIFEALLQKLSSQNAPSP